MAAVSDYGSTFVFNGVTYKCFVVGFPEFSDDGIDTTNHSSGGADESIPSKLVRKGDLTLSILNESTEYSTLRTCQSNGTVATATLTNNINTFTGSAWVKSVKPEDADAQSPKANALTVVIKPTGVWS